MGYYVRYRKGTQVKEFCAEKGLVIKNTWCKRRNIHKYMWVSKRDGMKAFLDYILIDGYARETHGYECVQRNSQRCLIITWWR